MITVSSTDCGGDDTDDDYDDDETSFDESEYEAALGTRPPLPKENLGPEYQPLIELFCACTDEDPVKRPSVKMAIAALESVKLWMSAVDSYYDKLLETKKNCLL